MIEKSKQTVSPERSLLAVEGISKSAMYMGGMFLAYKLVSSVADFVRGRAEEADEEEQNRDRARRDFIETQRREDEKDSREISKQVRREWAEREKRKLPPRPKAVRGHWEGNVFIPNESTDKKAKR